MATVTIRELRNHGGAVIDRVQTGECLTVTRLGRPVAELHPLTRTGPDPTTLLERWSRLPHINPEALRHDIDQIVDPSL
ncbi:MAG: type II toxin-antitoxin system prevent-host-death family antitoxin [Acidimicrobiaceae bacterium]|nr:type II toxin-antitoxin system prevent-host-death family antitoxin [Acidimicrobiaceae bacterium]